MIFNADPLSAAPVIGHHVAQFDGWVCAFSVGPDPDVLEYRCQSRLPLIGISARSAGNEEALCLVAGMDAFLRKPVTGQILATAIAGINA